MSYQVTYEFLDKDKKCIKQYINACFSQANVEYNKHRNVVYFKYIVDSKLTLAQDLEYIKCLNAIKWFHYINPKQYMTDKSFVFKIKTKNSFKTFATLTALRYLDENRIAVLAILKNKDNIHISKMKLLLFFGAMYTTNTGHNLNKPPIASQEFIDLNLPTKTFDVDNSIITYGLNEFFSTRHSGWGMDSLVADYIIKHYHLK